MKKVILRTIVILFFLLVSLMTVLSTIGFKTDRFNQLISNRILENNKNFSLKLEKIKFKFDIKNFNLFLETKNPEVNYKNLKIPIKEVKAYLDFISLLKSKPKINMINISSKELDINQLKRIISKTKPSNLNSLVTNRINNGKIVLNLELFFDDSLNINDFIAKGEIKEMNGIINNELSLKNTSFNFFADSTDVLIKNITSETDGLLIKNGNLKIDKNEKINVKLDFSSEVNINKNNINNFLPYLKNIKFINKDTNFYADLDNFLNITFDKTLKVTDYDYSNKGRVKKLLVKFGNPIQNSYLVNDIANLYIKESNLNVRYSSDKNNSINAVGLYSIDNQNYHNFEFKDNISKGFSNIDLNLELDQELSVEFINYKKEKNTIAKIFLNLTTKKDLVNIKKFNYKENKNSISIEDLKINKKNLISLKKIQVKTFDKKSLKNDFILEFGKKIKVFGNKYDAKNLNKFLTKKSDDNILKKISKDIDIDLKNIDTPLSKKLINFRLIGVIEKGKFIKISSKGDFGNNKFLDISMKNDKKNKRKYLEIYSDLPQPLLSEYNFFKGLSEGVLTLSSIIEDSESSSKLIIEDFKLVNAPGVVKLLSLADLGGLADLAEGDGLSFDKLEIKMSNNKGFLKLEEIFAVGPSISVLMEGYKTPSGLVSLRGTLVPAKNLNKILSKIPVIGNIIIPKDIGEGLFGISFKMKGPPGKIKTTINPLKTLTPRFITKALEKSKESK